MFVPKQVSDWAHFAHTEWDWICLRAGLKVKNVRFKWAGVDSRVGLSDWIGLREFQIWALV